MGTEYGYGYEKNLKPRIRKRYGNGIILKTWCGIRKVYGLILKAEYGIRKRYGPTSIYMYGYGIRIVIGTSEYGPATALQNFDKLSPESLLRKDL